MVQHKLAHIQTIAIAIKYQKMSHFLKESLICFHLFRALILLRSVGMPEMYCKMYINLLYKCTVCVCVTYLHRLIKVIYTCVCWEITCFIISR